MEAKGKEAQLFLLAIDPMAKHGYPSATDIREATHTQEVTEGTILCAGDDDRLRYVASQQLWWLGAVASPLSLFVIPSFGLDTVRFCVFGACITKESPRGFSETIESAKESLLQVTSRASLAGLTSGYLTKRRDVDFYYVQLSGFSSHHHDGLLSLAEDTQRELGLRPEAFSWRHPEILGQVVGVPGGLSPLATTDVVIGNLRQLRRATSQLEFPSEVMSLLVWRGILTGWSVEALAVLRETDDVINALATSWPDTYVPNTESRVPDQFLSARYRWLSTYRTLRKQIREVREACHSLYNPELFPRQTIERPKTHFVQMTFLTNLSKHLEEGIRSVEEETEERNATILDLGEQASQRASLIFVRQNLTLQRGILRLTGVLAFLTVILLLLTVILAMESSLAKEFLGF